MTNVELYVNVGSGYVSQQMNDNGLNAVAGDSLYTTTVPAQTSGTLVKYYALATDDIAQQDKWPNNAPTEYRAYTVDYTPPNLRITEILAVNDSVNSDSKGEYEDWIEIYNRSNEPFDLSGCFLSDSRTNNIMWEFPTNTILQAYNFIVIYEDAFGFGFSSQGDDVIMLTAAGKYIKTLINHVEEAGNKSVQWHGDNNKNQPVASGFYIVKIQTNEYKQIKKMLLLK